MLPEYGGNVRRSSQAATDALLEEQADLGAADPGTDPSAAPPPPPLPAGALASEAIGVPESETLDSSSDAPPTPPPPDAPTTSTADGGRHRGSRLDLIPPILLAALGLVAAVIAWRVGVASNIADDANRAGLDATRQRALAVISNEGDVARAMDAFLDYERDRQRGDALAAAQSDDQAQVNRMSAAAFWGDVAATYLDRNGQFQPAQERAALLAQEEQNVDIQPLDHFETADAAYVHLDGLILAGIVIALALPFLTLAEVGRGRLRGICILLGTGIFGTGVVLAVLAWI